MNTWRWIADRVVPARAVEFGPSRRDRRMAEHWQMMSLVERGSDQERQVAEALLRHALTASGRYDHLTYDPFTLKSRRF